MPHRASKFGGFPLVLLKNQPNGGYPPIKGSPSGGLSSYHRRPALSPSAEDPGEVFEPSPGGQALRFQGSSSAALRSENAPAGVRCFCFHTFGSNITWMRRVCVLFYLDSVPLKSQWLVLERMERCTRIHQIWCRSVSMALATPTKAPGISILIYSDAIDPMAPCSKMARFWTPVRQKAPCG